MLAHTVLPGRRGRYAVFIHGLFGRGSNFRTPAQAISDLATPILIDLPNHGSSLWTESADLVEWASMVVDTMASLGAVGENTTVIGHSLGARIAMIAALTHPDAFGKVLIGDMSAVDYPLDEYFMRFVELMKAIPLDELVSRKQASDILADEIRSESVRAFLLQNLRRLSCSESAPPNVKVSSRGWFWQPNLDLFERELSSLGRWPAIKGVFAGPAWWIGGGRSSYVRDAYQATMRQYFPKLRKLIIHNAGHWIHADQPAIFTTIVKELIVTPT